MSTETSTDRPALLIVDAQVDVLSTCIDAAATVANIAALVDRARAAGVPVVWVQHNADTELIHGTPGWEIVADLRPADGEPVVDKRYGDSFADTDLAERLKEVGATSVVLCGAQTDACIRSTFYGGIYRGYPVTVVTDAHTTEDMQEWGVGYTPQESINVLNTQAAHTVLPTVRGSTVATADAFPAAG